MTVPTYEEFYNSFLLALGDGKTHRLKEIKKIVEEKEKLSSEQLSATNESGQFTWENRFRWCSVFLKKAGLVTTPHRAIYQITQEGRELLAENITITDKLLIERYPSFAAFKQRKKESRSSDKPLPKPDQQVMTAEAIADDDLIKSLQEKKIPVFEGDSRYSETPKAKADPVLIQGRSAYPRSRTTAINALARASFKCEIDSTHPTFLRRNSMCQYTEPHHLIPMAYQIQFDVSLDIEANIVSLCCTCHKRIHYGADAEAIVAQLYEERKDALCSAGILISKEQLLSMYE